MKPLSLQRKWLKSQASILKAKKSNSQRKKNRNLNLTLVVIARVKVKKNNYFHQKEAEADLSKKLRFPKTRKENPPDKMKKSSLRSKSKELWENLSYFQKINKSNLRCKKGRNFVKKWWQKLHLLLSKSLHLSKSQLLYQMLSHQCKEVEI